MQASGDLVLYNSLNQAQWSSKTNLNLAEPKLVMQNDGNLVLFNRNNQPFWASKSFEITRKFTNQATKKCLSSNSNGAVSTSTCNSAQNQNWVVAKYSDGFSKIKNKASGLYLANFLYDSGSFVSTRAINDATKNQDWIIIGSQVLNRATNRSLESNSEGMVFSSNMNSGDYQKWN